MNIFEITIQRKNDSTWPAIAEQSTADRLTPQRSEGQLGLHMLRLHELEFDNLSQLPQFDAVAAYQGVQAALGSIPATVLAHRPGAAGSPTLAEICVRITAEPYTVLHIVCHGRALPNGKSALGAR